VWLVFGEAGVQFGIQMIRRGGATVVKRSAARCAGGLRACRRVCGQGGSPAWRVAAV
jgi:hypothetical protein